MKRIFLTLLFAITVFLPLPAQIAAVELSEGSSKNEVEDIIVVFKMHFDIGYTDWAESVLQDYATRMMDETLSSVEKTDGLPARERFIWTLPGWPMKYILENTTPERRARVEDAIRNGRLKVHALPFTFETEASDMETLVRGLSFSSDINTKFGQPLARAAKLTDVPSHSWFLPTLLTHAGVKFLHIGCNPGSTSPDLPVLFWWEGPDGSRLLTFNWAEYYGSGVMPPENWPYKTWLAMIHTHENTGAPTPESVAAILAEAREKAPGVNVRIGQLEDFYDCIIRENPDIPVIRGDMPDTWIHGYMSMPEEMKLNKYVQRLIFNEEALNSLLKDWNIGCQPEVSSYVRKACEYSALFDEHTFGLAFSHGNQEEWKYGDDFEIARGRGGYMHIEESWREKGDRIHQALRQIYPSYRKDLKNLANSVAFNGHKVVVYNPLPWKRSGTVDIYMGVYQKNYRITALKDLSTGKIIPVEQGYSRLMFNAEDVPSMGYKTYSVITDTEPETVLSSRYDKAGNFIENEYFKVIFDADKGTVASLVDKKSGKEMVGKDSGYGFGEYFKEVYGNEQINNYNSKYVKPGNHGWADQEMARPLNDSLSYMKTGGRLEYIRYESTPLSASASMFFRTDLGEDYVMTYTVHDGSPYLELNWSINGKKADARPEGGWIALPFNIDEPSFRLGRLGAVVDPATDYISRTNHDYCFLNTGMALYGKDGWGAGINIPDSPAVSLERTGLYEFNGSFIPKKPDVFVNLFNTQWGTNFTEWIDGGLSSTIYLWSFSEYENEKSLITPVEETRVPLVGSYSVSGGGNAPVEASGIVLSEKGILVTAFALDADGDSSVLRLWEQAGRDVRCLVTLPEGNESTTAIVCNLRGEPSGKKIKIKNGRFAVDMKAYQPASFILQ